MLPEVKPTDDKRYHYFLASGEVQYINPGDKKVKTMKVNGIHKGNESSLIAKDLGQIQTMFQMHFHTKYSRTHPAPPEITDVVLVSISYLGYFTSEQFLAGAPE